ncbi:MAG: hypothetical protein JNM17_01845 [Archangium sp.]|nr:hypothetical protein [Archangium sp.]
MKKLIVAALLIAVPAFADEKKGSSCRLLDDKGTEILKHDSEGTSIKCQFEIREEIKKQRCESTGQKLTFTYIGQGGTGKDLKPLQLNITCPRK